MAELDVCIETVFTDLRVEERIAKTAELGYDCIEFWHPEATWDGSKIDDSLPKDADTMRQACEEAGVTVAGFVLNAWDGLYGGCPVRSQDRSKFVDQVHKTVDFAQKINCKAAVIMTGVTQPDLTRQQMRENMEKAFGEGLDIAVKNNFTLLLEPLNTLVDHKGFYLDSTAEAVEIVRSFGSPNLKLLYDIYHMQIMNGNVVDTIRENVDIIGHMHVAGVPGRAEPNDCELNYPFIFRKAEDFGYQGNFGLEYFPRMNHGDSLRQQLMMCKQ
jgi:hydroxypyruvate isomerase